MKILLFGGTRFMGRYAAQALSEAGAHVTIANRGTREAITNATNVICDRSLPDALEQFSDQKFDAIVDFSAYASEWVERAGKFFAGKIDKYLFISTGAVYTSSQIFPITENFPKGPPHPFAPYAAEKIRSENLLRDFSQRGDFQTTACRLPFVLGPENYEDRESFVFSRLLANRPIFLENGGRAIHSFIYAGDVADALVAILQAPNNVNGEEFNVAIPQATTSRGFVDIAAEIYQKETQVISYQASDFDLDVTDFNLRDVAFPFPENNAFLSSDKINTHINFAPKKSLPDMLEIYLEWWLSRGDLLPKEYPLETRIKSTLGF